MVSLVTTMLSLEIVVGGKGGAGNRLSHGVVIGTNGLRQKKGDSKIETVLIVSIV